jgi:SAM-dependent methyltransferase
MATPQDLPRIAELASKIGSAVAELQEHLAAKGIESPSFKEDSPRNLPAEVSHLQDALLDATAELHDVLLDPVSLIFKFSATTNMVSIGAIARYHIAELVPLGGQISFEDISKKSGMSLTMARRLIRHGMSMRIFQEPEPGMVAHTKISKFLTIPEINAWVQVGSRDGWAASTRIVDAMQKWPDSEEPNETGFSLANNTDKTLYEVLQADPERAMRFAKSMKSFNYNPGLSISDIPKLYDWGSLGNAKVVDVGGSRGHVAIEVAKHFEGLSFIVQDMETVVKGAEADVPDELKGRVEFMAHQLTNTQEVQADVYFFRQVFHNWADKYAVKFLEAQIPALRPGARILIQDHVMKEPGQLPLWRDRDMRAIDIGMAAIFNARERYLYEWKDLLARADKRFVLQRVIEPEHRRLAILEIVWDAPSQN